MNRDQIYTSYIYSYPHKTAYADIDLRLKDCAQKITHQPLNIYFHIPFCETKCGYCNLFSVTGKGRDYIDAYINAMKEQTKQYEFLYTGSQIKSLTIGGGTPMILEEVQLIDIFRMADAVGALDAYSCIETSPNQTTTQKIHILKENKVNRVSIGIQSFVEDELEELQRNHSKQSAKTAIAKLKDEKFDCLNLDLIYGMKAQTTASIKYSLEHALAYLPEELFVYPLYIRKGTGLHGTAYVPNERSYEFYWYIRDFLLEHGYQQISMRRFVLKKPKNNTGCSFESTLSFGCGGRSYFDNIHFCTPYAITRKECLEQMDDYIEKSDYKTLDFGYILNDDEQKRRYILKNLLYVDGVDTEEYKKIFKQDIKSEFHIFYNFEKEGYCFMKDKKICLTSLGMSLSDYLGPMFISDEVKEKMKRWWTN